jgi:uncharacterized protein YbjT (DUF2867 family)
MENQDLTPFLVSGASGLVGGALVRRLLADEAGPGVVAVVRKPLGLAGGRLTEVVADFGRLEKAKVPRCDTAFCSLGTTIGKAGSEAAFRAVDVEAVVAFARLAHRVGAKRFLLVSALGADPRSKVFDNRTKGEAEEAVTAVGFEGVAFFRPSLLVGGVGPAGRARGDRASLFSWAMAGPVARWKPVPAEAVAAAMVAVAHQAFRGARIVENDEIHRLAK